MTCRNLAARYERISEDMGLGGESIRVLYCIVGRPLGLGEAGRCRKAAADGPCWLWLDGHGTEPDPYFGEPASQR